MFLCDTNIISELSRSKPNQGVIDWVDRIDILTISVITVEEIYFGLAAKPNPRITAWWENLLISGCEILPVTTEIAEYTGNIRGSHRTKGQVRHQADMLIAATAKIHDLTVVTRNTKDFEGCGIKIFNPFDPI